MKGLEKALDIIEAKIGKRKDFVVQDVLDYFDDEDIVEILPVVEKKGDDIKEVPSLLELEHYGITGERTEEHGYIRRTKIKWSLPTYKTKLLEKKIWR